MNIKENIIKKAIILLVIVFTVSGCAPPDETVSGPALPDETISQDALVKIPPEPLIYRSGGEAYMTTGADTVKLPGAVVLNGVFAAGSLYYITDTEDTGVGTLMRAGMDCKSEAAAIAENVCAAEVSCNGDALILRDYDGKAGELYCISQGKEMFLASRVSRMLISDNGERALFVSGYADGAGELYSWDFTGKPELTASGVSPDFLGFSPNAKNIYYVTKDGSTYALYVKLGGAKAIAVDEREGGSEGAECFSGFIFRLSVIDRGYLSDNGQMLYFGEETFVGKEMYVFYPGSKTEKYPVPCLVDNVFDDGSLLFTNPPELYYKEPGKPEQKLSEHMYTIPIFGCYSYFDMPQVFEKRFLLMEDSDSSSPHVKLFEQEIGKDAFMLGEADRNMFTIDYGFTKVAYVIDGSMYIREKMKSGWSSPELVAKDVRISYMSEVGFDTAGTCLYYLSEDTDMPRSGKLYRYDVKRGENELLLNDVFKLFLVDDVPFAETADGKAWAIGGNKEKLTSDTERIADIVNASGGMLIKAYPKKGGLYYYCMDSGETTKLCEDAMLQSADGIEYRPPLTKEQKASLQKLWQDAKACLAALDAGETVQDFSQDAQLADILRSEVSDKYNGMLGDFSNGFFQMPHGEDTRSPEYAKEYIIDAVGAYEDIFGAGALF